jgi:hypothetical protein
MGPKGEYQKLIESAREHQRIGELASFAGMVFLALALFYAAFDVYRKGLKISKTRTLTGTPANVLAIALVVVGVGVVVFGLFFWPGLLRSER